MKKYGIKIVCIPNIEIVRSNEILLHDRFDEIWCNNNLCYDVFKKYIDENKLKKISFGIKNYENDLKQENNIVTFLFLGGLNAFSRKNIIKVLEAFNMVKKHNLICCVQKINKEQTELIKPYIELKNVKFIFNHLSCKEINELYNQSDCVIQVSSHEGLGLGFYESLAHGLPVITLDCEPHNEIITNDVGFNIKCKSINVPDNDLSLIKASTFNVQDLIDCLENISVNAIIKLKDNCRNKNEKLFNDFENNFKNLFTSLK